MPDRNQQFDIFNLLSALGAFGQGAHGVGPQQGFMSADEISPALDPSVLGDLGTNHGTLSRPEPDWGHIEQWRNAPIRFGFGANLPLEGALRSLPPTAVLDVLRSFSPQLDFRAVSPNPWSPPNEYGVGITGGWRW